MDEKRDWPVYPKEHVNKLIVGNLENHIGIVTLWKPVEKAVENLDKHNYAVAGQLVTKSQGLSAIIRNCLLHGRITDIIITGNNKTGTKEALEALVKNSINKEDYKVIGIDNSEIEPEIPFEYVELFRKNIRIHNHQNLDNSLLESITPGKRYAEKGKLIFPDHKIPAPKTFPWDGRIYTIREKTIGEAWPEVLWAIRRFGELKPSKHGEQQEIQQMNIEITDENPSDIKWFDYFPFSKKDLEDYLPEVTTGKTSNDLKYTYGSRIFAYNSVNPEILEKLEQIIQKNNYNELEELLKELKTYNNIDQIKSVVSQLKTDRFSRAAYISLWNPKNDALNSSAPCINVMQFIAQQDKLNLFSLIRSNDMAKAWPMNTMALRKIQGDVASEASYTLGSLITISVSAHIYSADSELAERVIQSRKTNLFEQDFYGNLVISVHDEEVHVLHRSPEGKDLNHYSGKGFLKLQKELVRDRVIGSISHALYTGRELQKAFSALRNKKEYTQDR